MIFVDLKDQALHLCYAALFSKTKTRKVAFQVKGWDADLCWIDSKIPRKERKSSQAWRNGRRQRQVNNFTNKLKNYRGESFLEAVLSTELSPCAFSFLKYDCAASRKEQCQAAKNESTEVRVE